MKIQFWSIGKQHESNVKNAIDDFTNRVSKYYTCSWKIISPAKQTANTLVNEIKKQESEKILQLINKDDYLVLLDEKGKQFTSITLANFIEQRAVHSTKNLIFLIGGAFGVDDILLTKANYVWKLSDLVFPHQIVRLILAEQIYRACTIIKNEKYHHT